MKSSKEKIKALKEKYGNEILAGFLDTLLDVPNAESLGLYDLAVLCANFNIIRNELCKEKDVINTIIEDSLTILNSGADCINNEKFLKDCFEDFRVKFNKLKECIN